LVLYIVQCAFEDRLADRFTILKYFEIADRLEDRFILQDYIIGRFPDRLGKAGPARGPARSKSADRLAKWVARTLLVRIDRAACGVLRVRNGVIVGARK
jgi:hypothetical protein